MQPHGKACGSRNGDLGSACRSVLLATVCGQPAFDLQRAPGVLVDIRHALDVAPTIGENETKLALWAFELPLLERADTPT